MIFYQNQRDLVVNIWSFNEKSLFVYTSFFVCLMKPYDAPYDRNILELDANNMLKETL